MPHYLWLTNVILNEQTLQVEQKEMLQEEWEEESGFAVLITNEQTSYKCMLPWKQIHQKDKSKMLNQYIIIYENYDTQIEVNKDIEPNTIKLFDLINIHEILSSEIHIESILSNTNVIFTRTYFI